ncbi:MAG: hypothetical protein FJ030_17800 [Chloroflexi bacterium]|nr:hypothetical protein [Chloroflexota bacterium]
MLALNRIHATRIVATPSALDSAQWPDDRLVFRIAADEALITPPMANAVVSDPYAIVVADSGFAGAWLPMEEALPLLEHACEWELPRERPAFAQGSVAGIPAKLWIEKDRVLLIVPAPFVADFEERMA